ncbi:MAG: hypothetical protein EA409_12935 [Saprospirales bacterium]|nr:MAG: hypothetical protein EA409_12935 [Saprospirales bacterium]
MKTSNFLITVIFLISVGELSAQIPIGLPQSTENAAIIGKSSEDAIQLRWAPANFSIWQITSNNGWNLDRAIWDDETVWPFDLKKMEFTHINNFRALTLDEWESQTDISNPLVAVAAQALFGNEETQNMDLSGGFGALRLVAEQQENRHALAMIAADLSADAASGLGLSYSDATVEEGKIYIYRLTSVGNPSGFGADTVYFPIQFYGFIDNPPPVQGLQLEENHGQIDILWSTELNAEYFTAFHVERSENGIDFRRINELPITTATGEDQPEFHRFQDSQVEFGKTYFYKVIGLTPFAEESPASEIVRGRARDLRGPVPPQSVTITQLGDMYSLQWDIPEELIVPDAMGWIVKRSINASGPFAPLHEGYLPIEDRIFIDENPAPILTNYYRIYAIDTAFNESPGSVYAAIWVDSIPPAAPVNLNAIIDSNGIVHIHWDHNTEIDLQGYRVFSRTDENKVWYQMTQRPISQNYWIDTIDLSSLERSIEYSVIATDLHYNISEYAVPYRLALPDLVAPSAPRWAPWRMDENDLILNWYSSSSSDVFFHRLLTDKGNGWELYRDFYETAEDLRVSIPAGESRNFALMALDTAGNASDTVFLRNITSISYEKLPPIENIQLTSLEEENAILIAWEYPNFEDVRFMIYRKSLDSEEVEVVGTFSGNLRSFKDVGPTSFAQGWHYHLKAISGGGLESDWSPAYTVTLNQ